jgi:bacterioferritin-associated ferredoxin
MIVCSCNVLTADRIAAAAVALAREDPFRPVTPGRLFRALGARPQCGTCFPTVRRIVADAGIVFTCPEPLASGAEEEEDEAEMSIVEIDIVFDPTGRMS